MNVLEVPAKAIRAQVIRAHLAESGHPGCVAFSCGNATRALRAAGVWVLDVAPGGALQSTKWWSPAEVHRAWPHLFDATSGHLPIPLMASLAAIFRETFAATIEGRPGPHVVPTGSGETVVCLAWAFPDARWIARYDDRQPATRYEPRAPLNGLVTRLCHGVERVR